MNHMLPSEPTSSKLQQAITNEDILEFLENHFLVDKEDIGTSSPITKNWKLILIGEL